MHNHRTPSAQKTSGCALVLINEYHAVSCYTVNCNLLKSTFRRVKTMNAHLVSLELCPGMAGVAFWWIISITQVASLIIIWSVKNVHLHTHLCLKAFGHSLFWLFGSDIFFSVTHTCIMFRPHHSENPKLWFVLQLTHRLNTFSTHVVNKHYRKRYTV